MLFFGLFFSFVAAVAQDGSPYLTKALDGIDIKNADLSTSGGSIYVSGNTSEKPRLEIYIKGNNNRQLSKGEIEQLLNDKYELVIETSSNKVKAHATRKGNWSDWKNALSISYKLYVPAKVNSLIRTSGGSVSLISLDGNHDFATSGGSLSVDMVKGMINGRTSGGSISVRGSKGEINLATSGGSISAEGCSGNIDLATSGGSLKLENLEGKIEATTSGGSIMVEQVKGELVTKTSGGSIRVARMKGSIDAGTSGGSVNVDIEELGSYVKLRTSAGGINIVMPGGKGLDLDLSGMKVNVEELNNFSGSSSNAQIRGTLNGGGLPVSAKASAGSVNLSFSGK
ncbi:MAG: hypothetical protein MUF24_10675 [Chitinophagaceae bacterium]|nr:hypothetical protein [Chitinophagaceae bacterium]